MALDLPLPKQVFGHPWMLFGKDKMSKSKGNVIYADDMAQQFGIDATRYYMLSEMPYGHDGAITYETIIARYNSDLANTLGNLVNRTVTMCHKYFGGKITNPNQQTELDNQLIACCKETKDAFSSQMDELRLADTLESIMVLARRSNKYIDETAPWILSKDETNHERLMQVMFNLIESIRYIAVLLSPFMPETSDKIMAQINSQLNTLESLENFGDNDIVNVGNPEPLFNRLDETKKLEELEAFAEANMPKVVETKQEPEGIKLGIEDFQKVSLMVAEIKSCEKVPKSDKLYRLMLDDGNSERQIVSGIAKYYKETDLIGKKVIIVANLNPAKLRGVESNGMLLAADCPNDDVKVIFIDDSIPNGSKVR